jgi:hypothetical protein
MHRDLAPWDAMTVGMFVQTFLLALTERGLSSCCEVSVVVSRDHPRGAGHPGGAVDPERPGGRLCRPRFCRQQAENQPRADRGERGFPRQLGLVLINPKRDQTGLMSALLLKAARKRTEVRLRGGPGRGGGKDDAKSSIRDSFSVGGRRRRSRVYDFGPWARYHCDGKPLSL